MAKPEAELRAQGHRGPIYGVNEPAPRAGLKWRGLRTKGQPYSRVKIVDVRPGGSGKPAVFVIKHPTRNTRRTQIAATRENVGHLAGYGLPFPMVSELLGGIG